MIPVVFFVGLSALVALSPVLLIAAGWLLLNWIREPFATDPHDDPIGDASLLDRRKL